MEITLKEITIRQLIEEYENDEELGVKAYGGRLDVRPAYQREFIYKPEQQQAVIDTVYKGFPLNVMYWAVKEDNTYELIDGQQRTLSICEFCVSHFSVKLKDWNEARSFTSLQDDEQEKILNYKLTVYLCKGTSSEKLDWFRTINIAGEKLTNQELRNAVYSGSWVMAAKKKFSKTGCVAYKIGNKYLDGSSIRQNYLETAIDWISKGKIDSYMDAHKNDANADELWMYFSAVIDWVNLKFTTYRKEMKGVEWGELYNKYKDGNFDTDALETQIAELMKDSDVQKKSGIYAYVLDGDEHHLGIRAFDDNTKREVYEEQEGKCKMCGKHFEIEQMEGDHITPWKDGGHTVKENCQMLCKECNRRKSSK